jgi:hypothetical protein
MGPFAESPYSTADHEGLAVKFLVSLFFLVQGIENFKRKSVRPSQSVA